MLACMITQHRASTEPGSSVARARHQIDGVPLQFEFEQNRYGLHAQEGISGCVAHHSAQQASAHKL